MHVALPTKKQARILGLKINEIDLSEDYSPRDKLLMMNFYKKKLRKLYPNKNI
ncbi:hypothetical protein H8R23_05130 [Flavobacterium sp. F-380]|uniref:Uncharacterized protein n=1 Tax=Flavobacterium kayseriense TaxID=2764714 RepID=A0ABR7J5I0_9FLAO|nr:hypothetical protein [Flavobacterium kayseriense]MBC5840781.1 hypothetical protein [Flavobacterium kayseriense]MBC5846549.1 hypothetical protein [Flavobacterium kayseriense]